MRTFTCPWRLAPDYQLHPNWNDTPRGEQTQFKQRVTLETRCCLTYCVAHLAITRPYLVPSPFRWLLLVSSITSLCHLFLCGLSTTTADGEVSQLPVRIRNGLQLRYCHDSVVVRSNFNQFPIKPSSSLPRHSIEKQRPGRFCPRLETCPSPHRSSSRAK